MEAMKKLEIVVDSITASRVIEMLRGFGASGWTRVPGVTGSGQRGSRSGGDPAGAFTNDLVIVVVTPEVADRTVHAIRPILRQVGGFCLVTDCLWVVHDR